MASENVDEELVDYEEDEEAVVDNGKAADDGKEVKK
eukprot:CAMPEP_0116012482 /NCGR_PEP_ID=MMETSP0321-20121206/5151_1 /TAXON_ID=163516 /ORGANISM="Leptocylindrus danicus var. danicus, Strain B650" /LENGTH=35 /DNA_ID= /DNA_START= /DNA_END= /DNA_ORIENTATION=